MQWAREMAIPPVRRESSGDAPDLSPPTRLTQSTAAISLCPSAVPAAAVAIGALRGGGDKEVSVSHL